MFFRHFLHLHCGEGICWLLDFINETPSLVQPTYGRRSGSVFLLEIFANNEIQHLDAYKSIFVKHYGNLVQISQIQQVHSEAPKLGHIIRMWLKSSDRLRIQSFMNMRQLIATCFIHDVHACIRTLRQGRPMFTHFFEQQHLYISASIPSHEVLHAFQKKSWMHTAERIQIQEDECDPWIHLSSFDWQDLTHESKAACASKLLALDDTSTVWPMASQRHLLAILPTSRRKIPKR